MTLIENLAARYIAVWNEPDPRVREETVAELWAPDGVEYTEESEFRGHEALVTRIAEAHNQFVRDNGLVIVGDTIRQHHGTVVFNIHLVPAAGGETFWSAVAVLTLDDQGRILRDHQFAL